MYISLASVLNVVLRVTFGCEKASVSNLVLCVLLYSAVQRSRLFVRFYLSTAANDRKLSFHLDLFVCCLICLFVKSIIRNVIGEFSGNLVRRHLRRINNQLYFEVIWIQLTAQICELVLAFFNIAKVLCMHAVELAAVGNPFPVLWGMNCSKTNRRYRKFQCGKIADTIMHGRSLQRFVLSKRM